MLVAHLCNRLPGSGGVLARLDAKVPPPLQDVHDRFGRDIEAGRPVDLQLTGRQLLEVQLFPRLLRSTCETSAICQIYYVVTYLSERVDMIFTQLFLNMHM